MLVHLPLGAWFLCAAADLAYLLIDELFWWRTGFLLAMAGTALALPTIVTGFLDLVSTRKTPASERIASRHMMLMLSAWTCFAASLIPHRAEIPSDVEMYGTLALTLSGLLLTIPGGHAGAMLIFRFGFGTGNVDHRHDTNDTNHTGTDDTS